MIEPPAAEIRPAAIGWIENTVILFRNLPPSGRLRGIRVRSQLCPAGKSGRQSKPGFLQLRLGEPSYRRFWSIKGRYVDAAVASNQGSEAIVHVRGVQYRHAPESGE